MILNPLAKPNRSGALDLLRFLAVLFVFFGHYTDTFNDVYHIVPTNHKYNFISRYATIALLVFFIVSGYVVTMTSIKRNLKDFLFTRLSRIYPLFWVSCLVAFLLPRFIQTHSYLAQTSFKVFLVNLTMIPTVFGYQMINPVFHTLMIELAFYFLVAIIIGFKLWSKILTVITIILIFCLINVFLYSLPVYIIVTPFIAGILFYLISINYNSSWKLYALLSINFMCALLSAKPLKDKLSIFYPDPNAINLWIMIGSIAFIYIVFLLIALRKVNIKSHPIFQMLGEIAYPFYLFHIYFLCFYWYFSFTIQPDVLLFGILFTVMLTSWALNKFVEKPLSKLVSWILISVASVFNKKKIKQSTEAVF